MSAINELMVISNWFPSVDGTYSGAVFVKEQLEALLSSKLVKHTTVISPQPLFYKQWKLRDYSKQHIDVYFPRFLYIPKLMPYHYIGDLQYKALLSAVNSLDTSPDILHSHFLWFSGYSGAKLKDKLGVPLVVTAHGYDVYDVPFRNKNLRRKVEFALAKADHVITVSKRNRRILIHSLSVPEDKISVIPNGYDSKKFHPIDTWKARNILGLPDDKYVLVSIGNLIPVKGHKYLIEALELIQKVHPSMFSKIDVYIVGDGKLRKYLQSLISKKNLSNSVHLVGHRPHDEIPLWINAADVIIISSLNEGVPTVLFEALGCGRPVVATAVGGIPEVITSENYGLLCPSQNSECLAEKILTALNKEWNRDRIRRYAEQFTWDNIAKKIFKVYNEALY